MWFLKCSRKLFALLISVGVVHSSAAISAEMDFSDFYDQIFQIQVVSPEAGSKSSIGSGFQVSADGLIVTNYHVVSDYINSPESYEIRYAAHDGKEGVLELIDFDVVNDLALLVHPVPDEKFFSFASKPLIKGENAYALGNPGDWGILMVPGPSNGFVEHSYDEQILFSGSLNGGMSGGPSLNAMGEVVGVNVATAGSQLSFLVPAEKARTMVDAGRRLKPENFQVEIADQIKRWQRTRLGELIEEPWEREEFAGRQLVGEIRRDIQCWGDSNDSDDERKVSTAQRSCHSGDQLYVSGDLRVGLVSYLFTESESIELNQFQFANAQRDFWGGDNDSAFEHSTNYRCETDFLEGSDSEHGMYVRVTTCIRAYKRLEGLYDSVVLLQNQESGNAFSAYMSLSGAEKDQINAFNRRFLELSL